VKNKQLFSVFKTIISPHVSTDHLNNIAGFLDAILVGANETRKYFSVTKPIQTKIKPKDANTLQTIADLKSSKKIIDRLKLYFPNDLLFDEELGFVRLSKTSNINIGGKFYIDPLDGTEPFSRGLPFYAVGGMYYKVNKTSPLYTVICLPFLFLNFIYFAQHKAGAYKIELIEQNKFLIPGKEVVPLLTSNKKHYKNTMIVIDNLWNNETQTYKSNFVNLVSKSISKWIQGIGSNLAQQALVADGK
jgi:fructose-1,6-bisphosphatase/inositol monophosphatase family enzyme